MRSSADRRAGPNTNLHRRDWLRLGVLGALGLSLPRLLRVEAEAKPAPRIKSCVLFLLQGGPSQLDIWDMKPQAPAEVRGPFKPIRTTVPGMHITEHLPRLAQVAHHFSIVRSMTHKMVFHNSATYYAISGNPPLRDQTAFLASENDFPHLGAQLALKDPGNRLVPAAVSLPNPIGEGVFTVPGQNAGFLGPRFAPLCVEGDPSEASFVVDGLTVGADVRQERLARYQDLLATVNSQRRWMADDAGVQQMTAYQKRALTLLTSDETRQAFELARESNRLRDRYGRNKHGQSLLLARRLVEAGVRLVTVYWGGRLNNPLGYWDTHDDLETRLKDELLPPFDQGFSAFLADLHTRGLLETTLVLCLSEFGRTPRMGQSVGNGERATGRDHWPYCYSLTVAGGSAAGGRILGRSDRFAAYPADDPFTPQDIGATLLQAFGIPPTYEVQDGFGRKVPLSAGRSRADLFGR
jgi:hypothetical protein